MPVSGTEMIQLTRFSIGEVNYASTRIKPIKVIHIARRLAPVLMVLKSLQSAAAPIEDRDPGDPVPGQPIPKPPANLQVDPDKWLAAMVDAVAGLSDDDANYVLRECLSVTRQVALTAERSLWSSHTDAPSESLTAGEILTIAGSVLAKTFADLMDELPALGIGDFKFGPAAG